jgi:catechol 2,3-dioxygenase-like lactoylglutathione lyase family enzyme
MDVQFITNVAVITPDPSVSRRLYVDALGLPLTAEGDGYLHSEDIDGSKSFGLWPLTEAAQACFGTPDWPADRPVPQVSIEFEVADADTVQVAADELTEKGFTLLHEARTEPWGQTVARLQSSEGAIIGLSYAPWMHSLRGGTCVRPRADPLAGMRTVVDQPRRTPDTMPRPHLRRRRGIGDPLFLARDAVLGGGDHTG